MKYIVILADGMADEPIMELQNKTPMAYAKTPTMDLLAKQGEVGLAKTIPEGMSPGSDTANLAVMGYDPKKYYTGRSPLEAVSMGVSLKDTDITFRCNLVTLTEEEEYDEKSIIDHSADEISTEEARELISAVDAHFRTEHIRFYPGVSYRHLVVWNEGSDDVMLTPPHDILGRSIKDYLPQGQNKERIYTMMKQSYEFLKDHPINQKRIEKGLKPANSIWIWGEGKKPAIPSFYEAYGMKGSVISAVDLIKGIGMSAGLRSIDVEGATGNIHTNFKGKAMAAIEELTQGQDFVYVHIEAPDECGHRQEMENKVRSIELIDEKVVKVIKEEMEKLMVDYRMMILPDHPTPLRIRTHTSEPVPYLLYDSTNVVLKQEQTYDEAYAASTGIFFEEGYKLMGYFFANGKK